MSLTTEAVETAQERLDRLVAEREQELQAKADAEAAERKALQDQLDAEQARDEQQRHAIEEAAAAVEAEKAQAERDRLTALRQNVETAANKRFFMQTVNRDAELLPAPDVTPDPREEGATALRRMFGIGVPADLWTKDDISTAHVEVFGLTFLAAIPQIDGVFKHPVAIMYVISKGDGGHIQIDRPGDLADYLNSYGRIYHTDLRALVEEEAK